MKKITIKLFSLFAVVLLLNGCGKTDPIIYSGPTFVSYTDGILGDYFVQADNTPYPITVGIPAPAGNTVTVNLNVVYASGTAGTHYDVPASVTIPAGAVTATFEVAGYFDNMTGRKDTLIIELVSTEAANFNTEYTLYLQQFCPFDVADFVGAWTATEVSDFSGAYDPYTINLAANPNGGDTLVTSDIWPYFPVKFVFDASNPAKFQWHIPTQFLQDHPTYGPQYIESLNPGPMSACDQTLGVLKYQVYVSAGQFESSTLSLVKD